MKSAVYVGIDVSQEYVDVVVSGNRSAMRVATSSGALETLGQQLMELEPKLILMEASGGFERLPLTVLPACRSPSSTRARCATSPARWDTWRRPTP